MDERRGGGEAEEGGKRRRKGGGKYYKESLRKCEMRVASSTTYTRDKKGENANMSCLNPSRIYFLYF